MKRFERIAEGIARRAWDESEQGWYSRTPGIIRLWTRRVAKSDTVVPADLENMIALSKKEMKGWGIVLGTQIRELDVKITTKGNYPAVVVFATIVASPEDVKGIKEGRP